MLSGISMNSMFAGMFSALKREVREIVPGASYSSADVVEACGSRSLCQVKSHGDSVLYIDEIAHLRAVGVFGLVAFEEADLSGCDDLIVSFADEASHITFVIFVRTENVEVFKANDLREYALVLCVEIEEMLRVSVKIERTKSAKVLALVIHPSGSVAVGCR